MSGCRALLNGEPAWQGYLRRIGMGGRSVAVQARLLKGIGSTPTRTRKALEGMLADGRMDGQGYCLRMDACDRLEEMWEKGIQTHTPDVDDDARLPYSHRVWKELPGGGHMKIDRRG